MARAARRRTQAVLAIILLVAFRASAGDWHFESHGTCSDCHTQHNSENGQPMRTDDNATPAPGLLLRATAMELCLSCHDGSNPNAPDVLVPVGYVAESAAGAFPPASGNLQPKTAHHVFSGIAEMPPGGTQAMILTCTTCHDPHGNANYRNLRTDPSQSGQPDISVVAKQTIVANGTNASQVYVPANVIYKSGISAWCMRCHGGGTPVHKNDHAVDKVIFGAPLASYATWAAVAGPRVPVDSPTDDTIPSQDDRVTCISCHKAHGSDHKSTLIFINGRTINSTCAECHNP